MPDARPYGAVSLAGPATRRQIKGGPPRVHIVSSLDGPGSSPQREAGSLLVASVDVEWSKNYRITNGNQSFCYSVVWVKLPVCSSSAVIDPTLGFEYTSVYLDHDTERPELIQLAAADLVTVLGGADIVTGHQLCSDLAVLSANAAPGIPAALVTARTAWRERRSNSGARVVDTRFDTGHLLDGKSRRLVDVCTELNLDVTQPELARQSMTALHRNWLLTGEVESRERITVLNLRHSLSTALVAAHAAGVGAWSRPVNVNAMLADTLRDAFGWLTQPTFRALLGGHDA